MSWETPVRLVEFSTRRGEPCGCCTRTDALTCGVCPDCVRDWIMKPRGQAE